MGLLQSELTSHEIISHSSPPPDVSVSDFEVVSGSSITLKCDVTGNSGGIQTTWKDSSGSTLGTGTSLVTTVTEDGNYTCVTQSTWDSEDVESTTTASVWTYSK